MKNILLILALSCFTGYSLFAQDGMGIGNSNPQEMLDVTGAIKIGGTIVGSADAGSIRWNGTNFQGYNGTIWINLDGGSGVDTDWTVSGANMYSGVTGNVGIGTTSPDVKFELYTGAATTEMYITKDGSQTSSLLFRNGVTGAAGTSMGLNTAEHFIVQNNIGDKDIIFNVNDGGTQKDMIFIDASAANVGINLSSPQDKLHVNGAGRFNGGVKANNGSVSVPSFRFYNDNNTGMYAPNADELGLVTGGSEAIRIDASGNVGVGTTTPSTKLHVAGQVRITGGTPGANKVLTSDATGLATWQTPVADGDGNSSNELQTLSQSGTNVTLSNGGGTISVADNDNNSSNELQTIASSGTTLTLSNGGGSVSIADNDNNSSNEIQSLSLSGSTLSISGSNNVSLAGFANTDNQNLSSTSSGTNRTINITGGSGTTISVADNDNSSTNEIQSLSISGSTVSLSNGGGSVSIPSSAAFTTTSNVTSNAPGTYVTDDFVFGSPQLDDDGNTDHDKRMFFDKSKAAFRAGSVTGTQWDDSSVGLYSAAVNYRNTASGTASFSYGFDNIASDSYTLAGGKASIASGLQSTAIGNVTTASGATSAAFGSSTHARSAVEFVLGAYNTDYAPISSTLWNLNDRLFVVGNGTSAANRSDAMVILKSGNTGIGTSVPSAKLDVEGTFQLKDGTEGANKVLTSDASGNATWQTPAADGDGNSSNELQTLSQSGTNVTLSNGGGTISVADNDNNSSNELQTIASSGTTLTLSNGGGSVSIADNDNNSSNEIQSLSLSGSTLSISGSNNVSLAGFANTDNQNLSSTSSGTNRTINITGGSGTTISVADNDNSSTNEIQSLSISGSTVSLSNGGGSVTVPADTDTQNTLDEAYNEGGAGAGRTITADNGQVEILGAGGLKVTAPVEVATGTAATPTFSFYGDPDVGMFRQGVDKLGFATGGVERLRLVSGRALFEPGPGTAADPAITFLGNPGLGFFRPATNELGIAANGLEKLRVTSTGVGVGATAPSATLDVEGTFQYVDGNEGVSKVLTSDVNGNATWQTPAADSDTQNTLDGAYDEGGVGAGRSIDAVDGTVAINGEDGFAVTGTFGSGLAIGAAGGIPTGAGTRMFFNPNKAAFRAGTAAGTEWDDANVGNYSVALGKEAIASGPLAIALGDRATASGSGSSIALGRLTTASGQYSAALGNVSAATGYGSTALGFGAQAPGYYSVAMGRGTIANAFGELVVGLWNTDVAPSIASLWIPSDRLFVVGNGNGSGNRSDAMVILKNGNTGIGTSTPIATLDVDGGDIALNDGQLRLRAGNDGNHYLAHLGGSFDGPVLQGLTTVVLKTGTFGDASGIFLRNNRVGVGIANPTNGLLHVEGFHDVNFSYAYFNSSTSTGFGSGNVPISIWAQHRIATSELQVFSDARIKNVIGLSNAREDLSTLMGIEVTNYTYKDKIGKGNSEFKKVVAQQLEEVYPIAVSQTTNFIPDVYQLANIQDGVISLSISNLEAGDKLKLLHENGEVEIAVVNSTSEAGILTSSNHAGNVFVYGREVDDFRTVDYEAISMLNVSATQEIVKQLNALKKENSELKNDFGSLKAEIEQLKDWTKFGQEASK